MIKKEILVIFITTLLCCCKAHTAKDKCVADADQAIAIAEKEWLKLYGNKIYNKKPFSTKIVNDSIWVVEGTIIQDSLFSKRGGVPYAEINAQNCKILKVAHGK